MKRSSSKTVDEWEMDCYCDGRESPDVTDPLLDGMVTESVLEEQPMSSSRQESGGDDEGGRIRGAGAILSPIPKFVKRVHKTVLASRAGHSSTTTSPRRTASEGPGFPSARQPVRDETVMLPSSSSSSPPFLPETPGNDGETHRYVQEYITAQEHHRRNKEQWPSVWFALMPCFSTIIGALCICRLTLQVILFKGPFILQFAVLSLILGVPFIILMIAVGHALGSGIVEMWFVSPMFKGLGIGLQVYYVVFAAYTSASFSWMMAYLSDSVVKNTGEYKWSHCSELASEGECLPTYNCSKINKITLNVWSYFKYDVMENHIMDESTHISPRRCMALFGFWLFAYFALFRRVVSFGRIASILNTLNIFIFIAVALKMTAYYGEGLLTVFDGNWTEMLTDQWSWVRACREVFFTWILLGGVTMQLCSHLKIQGSLGKFVLALLALVVIMMTFTVMFALCLGHGLKLHGASFIPTVVKETAVNGTDTLSLTYSMTCLKEFHADPYKFQFVNYLVGDSFASKSMSLQYYTEMRMLTELFPSLLAAETVARIPSIMSFLLYFCLLGFAMTQLLSVWICFEESLIKVNEKMLKPWTPILSFTWCLCGALFGLLLASRHARDILYFLDVSFSSVWWSCFMTSLMMTVVTFLNSDPNSVDEIFKHVCDHELSKGIRCLLSAIWGVFLPLCYVVAMIGFLSDFQLGVLVLWPVWPSALHVLSLLLQAIPLMICITVMLVQCRSYMTRGRNVSQNIRSLICPVLPLVPIYSARNLQPDSGGKAADPPPKYTPPPSYSAATGRTAMAMGFSRSMSLGDIENHLERRNESLVREVRQLESLLSGVSSTDLPCCCDEDNLSAKTCSPTGFSEEPSESPLDACFVKSGSSIACTVKLGNTVDSERDIPIAEVGALTGARPRRRVSSDSANTESDKEAVHVLPAQCPCRECSTSSMSGKDKNMHGAEEVGPRSSYNCFSNQPEILSDDAVEVVDNACWKFANPLNDTEAKTFQGGTDDGMPWVKPPFVASAMARHLPEYAVRRSLTGYHGNPPSEIYNNSFHVAWREIIHGGRYVAGTTELIHNLYNINSAKEHCGRDDPKPRKLSRKFKKNCDNGERKACQVTETERNVNAALARILALNNPHTTSEEGVGASAETGSSTQVKENYDGCSETDIGKVQKKHKRAEASVMNYVTSEMQHDSNAWDHKKGGFGTAGTSETAEDHARDFIHCTLTDDISEVKCRRRKQSYCAGAAGNKNSDELCVNHTAQCRETGCPTPMCKTMPDGADQRLDTDDIIRSDTTIKTKRGKKKRNTKTKAGLEMDKNRENKVNNPTEVENSETYESSMEPLNSTGAADDQSKDDRG